MGKPTGKDREVKKILDHRVIRKEMVEYLVQWKGLAESENTWEHRSNLKWKDLKPYISKSQTTNPGPRLRSSGKLKSNDKEGGDFPYKRAFDRGLQAEKILGVDGSTGHLMFLIKFKGLDKPEAVPASDANMKIPQMVIAYYEKCSSFDD